MNEQEMKEKIKEKYNESREVHKYMQNILNEKIDKANEIIKGLSLQTNNGMKDLDIISKDITPFKKKSKGNEKKRKRTEKKKKKNTRKKKKTVKKKKRVRGNKKD